MLPSLIAFFSTNTYTYAILSPFRSASLNIAKMARTFFVGGNWKMNGSLESTKQLTKTLREAKLDFNVGE